MTKLVIVISLIIAFFVIIEWSGMQKQEKNISSKMRINRF